jgi:uncharacterized protein YdaU (DUF1376 family)
MSEKDLPHMPVFVKDWIAATQHWTDAERGAYFSLLCHQWVNNMVPTDETQLARIMGTPEKEFENRWATVGAKFDGDTEGLFNNRLEEHRKKALSLRDAKARGADAANVVRRAKKTQRVAAANAEHSAVHDAEATPTSTSTSTSTYPEEDKNPAERSANAERVSRGSYWKEEKFLEWRLDYPKRAGGVDPEGGKKACKARLREGHTWEELFERRDKYRMYCERAGITGTQYVMTMKTFLGPGKRFLEDWDSHADAARDATWTPPTDELEDPA